MASPSVQTFTILSFVEPFARPILARRPAKLRSVIALQLSG